MKATKRAKLPKRRMEGGEGPAKALRKLRKRGWDVNVTHWRRYERKLDLAEDDKDVMRFFGTAKDAKELGLTAEHVLPNGGATFVHLFSSEQQIEGNGRASCHVEDKFDRDLGLRIALGRALKDVEDARTQETLVEGLIGLHKEAADAAAGAAADFLNEEKGIEMAMYQLGRAEAFARAVVLARKRSGVKKDE